MLILLRFIVLSYDRVKFRYMLKINDSGLEY